MTTREAIRAAVLCVEATAPPVGDDIDRATVDAWAGRSTK